MKFITALLALFLAVPAFAQQKTVPTPPPAAAAAKEPTVEELKKQIADKDYQIAQLSLQIAQMNATISVWVGDRYAEDPQIQQAKERVQSAQKAVQDASSTPTK
jgi:TolA-binding protein